MCVAVTLLPGTELTVDEVVRMHRSNADGVGLAWARDGMVSWWKTLKVDPDYVTKAINAWRDYPRLLHFRYATAGGARPDLCHPFEIGPLANCSVTGSAAKVMIHNGHWNRWDDVKKLFNGTDLLPKGPWSDSRLAAYLADEDPEWLTALGGRVAVMEGGGEILRLGDWSKLRDGIMVSNEAWKTATHTRGGYPGYRQWKGWNWNEEEMMAYQEEQLQEAAKRDAPVESLRQGRK